MQGISEKLIATTLWLSTCVFAQEPSAPGASSESRVQISLDPAAVVILPFEVLTTKPEYGRLAELVHDEFLRQVRTIDGVHVIDPALVRPYAATGLEAEEIARQLGAATVLQGSVVGGSRGYYVRYEFIDVRNGRHHLGGMRRSFEEWVPNRRLDEEIVESITALLEPVEQKIFPDRRSTNAREPAMADARTRFLNAGLSDDERLRALRQLAPPIILDFPNRYASDSAPLKGEIAVAAAQLAAESVDPGIRAAIWRIMTGVDDPNLVDPLLHALAGDADARVRETAAVALAGHVDAAGVRDALAEAAEYDPARSVRNAACLASATRDQQRAALQLTIMDTSLPDQERTDALRNLWRINVNHPAPADEDLAAALLAWARSTGDTHTRRLIWSSFGQMGGAAAARSLLEALSFDRDEDLREAVIESLGEVIGEAGVRDALVTVLADDESPLVRAAAERALEKAGE